jgi:hypothetical protein
MLLGTAAVTALGVAYLGGLLFLLLGKGGAPGAAGLQTRQAPPQSLLPVLASLGITCCWLGYAMLARRRGRPRARYHLLSPEDL